MIINLILDNIIIYHCNQIKCGIIYLVTKVFNKIQILYATQFFFLYAIKTLTNEYITDALKYLQTGLYSTHPKYCKLQMYRLYVKYVGIT